LTMTAYKVLPSVSGPLDFTLLSWNCLMKGFGHMYHWQPLVKKQDLVWENRQPLIIETLKKSNADILCLQEIENPGFDTDFAPHLSSRYDFVVQKPKKSKGGHTMYMAICWNREKFEKTFENHRSRTLVLGLLHRASGKRLMLINAHFEGTPEMIDIRLNQLKTSLQALRNYLRFPVSRKKFDNEKHTWAIEVTDFDFDQRARGWYHRKSPSRFELQGEFAFYTTSDARVSDSPIWVFARIHTEKPIVLFMANTTDSEDEFLPKAKFWEPIGALGMPPKFKMHLFAREGDQREIPTILCGDFNEDDNGALHHVLTNRSINPAWRHPHPELCDVQATKAFYSHEFDLKDCYRDVGIQCNPTWFGGFKGWENKPGALLDFVLYSPEKLDVKGVLVHEERDLKKYQSARLPNIELGAASDHIPIGVHLEFLS